MKKKIVLLLMPMLVLSLFIVGTVSADGWQWPGPSDNTQWYWPNNPGQKPGNPWNNNPWNNNPWNNNHWNTDCQNPCYGYNCNPGPSLCATFISDVTIADGTYVAPGSSFTKTWRIKNSGNVTWNSGYRLVFSSGNQMSAPSSVALPYSVSPGQTVDISVNMVAPTYSGTFRGNWMIQSDTGYQFGVGAGCKVAVWAEITTRTQYPQYPNNCNCYNCYCYPQPCSGQACYPQQPVYPQPNPWPNWP